MAGLMAAARESREDVRNERERRTGRGQGANTSANKAYFNKDFGWVLTRDEVSQWGKYKGALTEQAAKYKKEVYDPTVKSYAQNLASAEQSINSEYSNAIASIPEWQDPKWTTFTVLGEDGSDLSRAVNKNGVYYSGEPFQVLESDKQNMIDAFVDSGYFTYDKEKDAVVQRGGTSTAELQAISQAKADFRTYVSTEYKDQTNKAVATAKENYAEEKAAGINNLKTQNVSDVAKMKAASEAEFAPVREQLNTNYNTITSQYDNEVARKKNQYNAQKANVNNSIQQIDIAQATAGRRGLSG